DRYALLPHHFDDLSKFMTLSVSKAAGDFIEQEESWFGRKRACELKSFSLEKGQRTRGKVGFIQQSCTIERIDGKVVAGALASARGKACRSQDVLKHRHATEWLRNLIAAADTEAASLIGRQVGNVAPAQPNGPGGRVDVAADEIEKRTLAG